MTMQAHSNKGGAKHMDGPSYTKYKGGEASQVVLFEIASEMMKANLPQIFIVQAVRTALDFEGVANLMKLWSNEEDQEEKNEIVADIQDMLDICLQKERVEEFYVKFSDLDTIANNIRVFKDSLLAVVSKTGGIKNLSELTDIPQPSLSRFFNSNAMPQRSTLLKIAKALDLDEIKMEALKTPEKYKKE